LRCTLISLVLSATLASVAMAEAQTTYSFPNTLAVVPTGQMSRIGLTTNLDINCNFLGYQQTDVVSPPSNGQVFIKHLRSEYPTYASNSDRVSCDKVKRPGLEILYKSQPGFTGTVDLVIRMLDRNHVPLFKPYTIQVQ